MTQGDTVRATRAHLEELDYGEHGLTRNEIRDQWGGLPDAVYLHLPDSKRFLNAAQVLDEARHAAAHAEGEFVAANDDAGSGDAAIPDGGPAGYGDDPLISPSVAGPTGNTPTPGFDGNSLETEQEFPTK